MINQRYLSHFIFDYDDFKFLLWFSSLVDNFSLVQKSLSKSSIGSNCPSITWVSLMKYFEDLPWYETNGNSFKQSFQLSQNRQHKLTRTMRRWIFDLCAPLITIIFFVLLPTGPNNFHLWSTNDVEWIFFLISIKRLFIA